MEVFSNKMWFNHLHFSNVIFFNLTFKLDLVQNQKLHSPLTSRAIHNGAESAEILPDCPGLNNNLLVGMWAHWRGLSLYQSSDVLLFGKSVRCHPRGRRGQALHWGVFKDGRGVRRRRKGAFWCGGGGAATAGRSGWLWVVGVLGQKWEWRVDGRGVGLWVILLVTGQSVAHVVRCAWKLFIKPSRMLRWNDRHTDI